MTAVQIIPQELGGTSLSRAALRGEVPSHWYAARPGSVDEWRALLSRRSESSPASWHAELAEALQASGAAASRLEEVARAGGVVVSTGQQPGLYGGPLYTWYKALSALAYADLLQDATGVPCAPLFWAATDDSDVVEARSTVVSTVGGARLIPVQLSAAPHTPLSRVRLPDMTSAVNELRVGAGSGSHVGFLEAAAKAYRSGELFGAAYLRLLREILSPLGIAVLDASHPAVRNAARPLLEEALRRHGVIDSALVAREREIVAAGYEPQVSHVAGLTPVFRTAEESGTRERIPFSAVDGALADGDSDLGPNVLLRAIVERAILPGVAYVAGPAETAYFAQVNAVAQALGKEPALAIPRMSAMIVEPQIRKLLDRYGVTPEELRDPHAVEGRLARSELPRQLGDLLARMRRNVDNWSVEAAAAAERDGLVTGRTVEGHRLVMQHRLDRLERRMLAAVKRRAGRAMTDIATARGALYPFGTRQERVHNMIPLLARHGDGLLEQLRAEAGRHAGNVLLLTRGTSLARA